MQKLRSQVLGMENLGNANVLELEYSKCVTEWGI